MVGDSMSVESDKINQSSDGPETTLYAYRSLSHRVLYAATLLIPFGTVGFFVAFCGQGGDYALDKSVDVTAAYRWALIIHGAYFIQLPFNFELLLTVSQTETVSVTVYDACCCCCWLRLLFCCCV